MDSRKRVYRCSSLAHSPRRDGSAPLDAIASMSSSSSQLLVIKGASTPKTPLTSKVRRHQRCIDVKENAGNKESSVASQRKRSSGQVCSRKCRQQEQSDLFMSLIYGFSQESTWMQLAGLCTSQGRLGTTYLSLFSLKRKRKRRIDLPFSIFS